MVISERNIPQECVLSAAIYSFLRAIIPQQKGGRSQVIPGMNVIKQQPCRVVVRGRGDKEIRRTYMQYAVQTVAAAAVDALCYLFDSILTEAAETN